MTVWWLTFVGTIAALIVTMAVTVRIVVRRLRRNAPAPANDNQVEAAVASKPAS